MDLRAAKLAVILSQPIKPNEALTTLSQPVPGFQERNPLPLLNLNKPLSLEVEHAATVITLNSQGRAGGWDSSSPGPTKDRRSYFACSQSQ